MNHKLTKEELDSFIQTKGQNSVMLSKLYEYFGYTAPTEDYVNNLVESRKKPTFKNQPKLSDTQQRYIELFHERDCFKSKKAYLDLIKGDTNVQLTKQLLTEFFLKP